MDGTGDGGYFTWNLRGGTFHDVEVDPDSEAQPPRTVRVVRCNSTETSRGTRSPARMAESPYGTGRSFSPSLSQQAIQIMQIPDGQTVRVVSGDGQAVRIVSGDGPGHGDRVRVIHCTPGAKQHMQQEQKQYSRTSPRVRVVPQEPHAGYRGIRILPGGQGIRILQGDTEQGVGLKTGRESSERGHRGSPEMVRIMKGKPGGQKVQYVRQLSHHQPEEPFGGGGVRIVQGDPSKGVRIIPLSGRQGFEINSQGAFVRDDTEHCAYHLSDRDAVMNEAMLSSPPDTLRLTRSRLQGSRRDSDGLGETTPTTPSRTQSQIRFHLGQPQRRNSHGGEETSCGDLKDTTMLIRGRPYRKQNSDTPCGPRRGELKDFHGQQVMPSQRPGDVTYRKMSYDEMPPGGATLTVQDSDGTTRTVQELRESPRPGDSCYSSPTGSAEPNFFNKFQFCFGSFGNFGRMNSHDRGRQVFFFNNFDDMMDRIGHLVGHKAKRAASQEQRDTCGG